MSVNNEQPLNNKGYPRGKVKHSPPSKREIFGASWERFDILIANKYLFIEFFVTRTFHGRGYPYRM